MPEQPLVGIEPMPQALVAVIQARRLDHKTTADMSHQVAAAADRFPGKPIIVDLSQLEFLRSETMGAFVELHQLLRKSGQAFLLAGVSRQMRSTLAVTKLDKRLEIHDTVESALGRFSPKPQRPPPPAGGPDRFRIHGL